MDWGLIGRAVAGGIGGASEALSDIAEKDMDVENKQKLAKTMADLDVEKQKRIEENTHAANVEAAQMERQRLMAVNAAAPVDPSTPGFAQARQRGDYALSQGEIPLANAHYDAAKSSIHNIGYGQEAGDMSTGQRIEDWGSSVLRAESRNKAGSKEMTPEQKSIQLTKLEQGYDSVAKDLIKPVNLPAYAADPLDPIGGTVDKDAARNVKMMALKIAQTKLSGDSPEPVSPSTLLSQAMPAYTRINQLADAAVTASTTDKNGPLLQGKTVDAKLAALLSKNIAYQTKGGLQIPPDQLTGDADAVRRTIFLAARDKGLASFTGSDSAPTASASTAAPAKAAPAPTPAPKETAAPAPAAASAPATGLVAAAQSKPSTPFDDMVSQVRGGQYFRVTGLPGLFKTREEAIAAYKAANPSGPSGMSASLSKYND